MRTERDYSGKLRAPEPPRWTVLSPHSITSTPAAARIAREIERQGPITFRRFMEIALYDERVGYYAQACASPGREADYLTSPEIHPAFGFLLCVQFEEMWRGLGSPSEFWLVEAGPGSGRFMADVLATAARVFPRFEQSLRVALIERSHALRALQAETLERWAQKLVWLDSVPKSWEPLGVGCVFANELLDAFAVHLVLGRADGLAELYVSAEHGALRFTEGPCSTSDLERQVAVGGGELRPGQCVEVNLEAPQWVQAAARLIDRGYVLLFDYGEAGVDLYGSAHPSGTLRCYRRHTMNRDPLSHVGQQDITAHVDFSAVTRAALGAGMELVGATRQRAFLGRLGLPVLLDEATRGRSGRAAEHAQRRALAQLVEGAGLGRILAVLFGKGGVSSSLGGFFRTAPLAPPIRDNDQFLWLASAARVRVGESLPPLLA